MIDTMLSGLREVGSSWTGLTRAVRGADAHGQGRPVVHEAGKGILCWLGILWGAAVTVLPCQRLIVAHVVVRTVAMRWLVGSQGSFFIWFI
jgi:hypothetical protein